MKRIAILATLAPTAALAHNGPAGHAHPHGVEGLLLGLAVVALAGWLAWRRSR